MAGITNLGAVSGFQAELAIWFWMSAVLLYGLWRSQWSAAPDPIRPSGPQR